MTRVFQENTTWKNASRNCISKGGTLAGSNSVECDDLLSGSVWLDEYQTYIWLQPKGNLF